ncbi:MAG: Hsp20/alpha crystallin family protein [Nitrospinaceae bacterium]|nr:MAG: Hsp20/alpha crystallin family protein [Nitrospinaceae bacterium]
MSLVTYNPFKSFDPFFDSEALEMPWENLFTSENSRVAPRVDIIENESDFLLLAEVPGFSEDQIHVDVEDRTLTLRGIVEEKAPAAKGKEPVYLAREMRHQSFERAFRLGGQVDTERVAARLDKGILHVTLPKKEAAKPKRINVKIGS